MLVVHEWWGHNEHARNQAIRLAKAGYVGFALDMYGKGKLATHPADARSFAAEATKDPQVVKARFLAASTCSSAIRTSTRRRSQRSATASAAASRWRWRARASTSTPWSTFHGALAHAAAGGARERSRRGSWC